MTPSYFTRYENLAMERTDSGVLTVRFHTDGGPIVFTGQTHRDLPKALAEIGDDRENKVVILTGTGEVFMEEIDGASLGEIFKPGEWDKIYLIRVGVEELDGGFSSVAGEVAVVAVDHREAGAHV